MQQGQVERVIYVGVDTHRDVTVAVAVDGTEVERTFFPTSRRGVRRDARASTCRSSR